ncbi:MAG: tetratricopeptide repeat protein [Candidatus Daviesbacteria bacterium]
MTKGKLIIILIVIGGLIYFNSFFNGFVWDDEEQILTNTLVHSISNLPKFFASSTFNSGGAATMGGLYYKPLMTTFFSLIYSIFGPNPFFFHFLQVILHIANSILVFLLFKHLLSHSKKNLILSFILALFFLIHPQNTEAVVYISDLQDILFFFFGMLALLFTIKKPLNLLNLCLTGLFLLLSLLSKETGIVFIPIIFIYLLFYQKEKLIKFTASIFTMITIYSLLRFAVAKIYFNKHGLSPITTIPLDQRLINIPLIIISYLRNFIFPQNLAINQHWAIRNITFENFFAPLFMILGVFSLVVFSGYVLWKKEKKDFVIFLFFFLWFCFSLGLHLHIFPLDLTVSDRWFYLPMVGLLGMIGVLAQNVKLQNEKIRRGFYILLFIIFILFSVRVMIRNTNWHDGLSLYSHDINIAKDSFDLENNLGVELFRAGKYDEAEIHFVNSTKLAPKWWTNWNNLGVMVQRKQEFDKALEYYQRAIDNGNYYLAYENLAKIKLSHESTQSAKVFTENALKRLPNNSNLWYVLSLIYYQQGNLKDALKAAQISYKLSPNQQNYYVFSRLSQDLPLEIK